MVFERISANTLTELNIKIKTYLKEWNPKLFSIDIDDLKRDIKTNQWITTIKRNGNLL